MFPTTCFVAIFHIKSNLNHLQATPVDYQQYFDLKRPYELMNAYDSWMKLYRVCK